MKKWTITVTEEDGKLLIERENDGFAAMDLLLILANILNDVSQQALGKITPEVKRVVVKREVTQNHSGEATDMIKRICGTCQWYAKEYGVCCNGDSEHRADFTSSEDTCPEWGGYGNYDVEMWGEGEDEIP